uniref:Dynein 2 intermediate chain 1 n=1 Tax=Leptobrachium leishanense TaxID=445787 RepID=A0A8C5MZX2_9ANUR
MRNDKIDGKSWRPPRQRLVPCITHGNGRRTQRGDTRAMQPSRVTDSERLNDEKKNKAKKHRRDTEKDEPVERRHKQNDKERREEREQRKYVEREAGREHARDKERQEERERRKHVERDRHADKEREAGREHARDREQKTDREKQDPNSVREKERERKHSGDGHGPRDYRDGDQMREDKERRRREMRDGQDKGKPRSDDRERRHRERREKNEKIQEKEDGEDRERRHRRHREVLNPHEEERERRRSDRKHGDDAERERRHRKASDRPAPDMTEQHVKSGTQEPKLREKETGFQEGDKEKRHRKKPRERDEREGNPTARRKGDKEAHSFQQEPSRDATKQKSALQDKESEKDDTSDPAQNTDAAYDDSTNYEEDFEDYDDDFEVESEFTDKEPVNHQKPRRDLKNPHLEDIQKAMALENEMTASFPSKEKAKPKVDRQESANRGAHRGTFIDFGTANEKLVNRQVASKLKKRSADLLRLIDLDFSCTVSLLDLAPVKEYDMYIRNFGKTNTKQAYAQCNEDCVDRDVQTEEIEIEEKWTQHPGEGSIACGGEKNNAASNVESVPKLDTQRLTCFLRSACQVVAVLLEEDRADRASEWKLQSKEHCMSISDGCFQINTDLPFLQDRHVHRLHFSETQRHLLLSAHGYCNGNKSLVLSDKFVICVWNIWEPSSPQHVLVCESEVGCCCFGPGKVALVFAGTADGSVVLWDLREDTSLHQRVTLADGLWSFRSPTFSTDGVFAKVNHSSPVKAIEPIHSVGHKEHGMAAFTIQEDVSGLSFQIATLDETGHLILWVVVELRRDDAAGSQNDLGLLPGGKVKLVHSSSIILDDSFFPKDILSLGSPQTLNIKFLPEDSNHFFIGTDIGLVTHGTRYGLIEAPRHYKAQHSKIGPSQVTAVDFSPFHVPVFLAGCSDGCIRLHRTSAPFPVMQWSDSTGGQPVVTLRWSLTRPSVYFVLDATGFIYIWDLLENDLQPVARASSMPDQIISMAVLGEPEKNNGMTGLALAKSSGKVEIQYIKKKWARPQPKEEDRVSLLLL